MQMVKNPPPIRYQNIPCAKLRLVLGGKSSTDLPTAHPAVKKAMCLDFTYQILNVSKIW